VKCELENNRPNDIVGDQLELDPSGDPNRYQRVDSISRRGLYADDLKNHPTYFLLRNAARRHANILQGIDPVDERIMERLVEEAVTEVLVASKKNWRVEVLKIKVRQALDRLVYRSETIVQFSDPESDHDPLIPSVPGTITPDSIRDPRNFEAMIIEKIDGERANAKVRSKILEVLTPAEWKFLSEYLDRDGHDAPATSQERARFARLKQRVADHLGTDFMGGQTTS
jgi:hypothetical protein